MRVGFIGAGHIATALAEGWSRPGLVGAPGLLFYDVCSAAAARLAGSAGGRVAGALPELVTAADVLVVAVRPQDVAAVLAEVGPLLGGRALVSVAAGVTMESLRKALPAGVRAGRVMPNVAAALGLGVFLYVPGTLGDRSSEIEALFALAGDVVRLEEHDFDTATAVAGCMPGILAAVVTDFISAGAHRGLDEDVARRLAVAAVHGAAAVIAREGDPAAVLAAAATPGGMTAAAVQTLEEREMRAWVDLAVGAAADRAKELT